MENQEINKNKISEESKKNIKEAFMKNSDAFEKGIHYISAGAIGLLLSMFDKIKFICSTKYLYLSIILFLGFSLIISMISYLFGSRHLRFIYKESNKNESTMCYIDKLIEKYSCCTKWFNIFTIISFGIGLVLILVFLNKIIN